jgi:hypothetical protein
MIAQRDDELNMRWKKIRTHEHNDGKHERSECHKYQMTSYADFNILKRDFSNVLILVLHLFQPFVSP